MTALCKVCYPGAQPYRSLPQEIQPFIPSSAFHSNLWALQYLYHQPRRGVNPTAPFPSMTPLCLSQECKEESFLLTSLHPREAEVSPLQQEREHPMGNASFSSELFSSWKLGRESDKIFSLREEVMNIYIKKTPRNPNNLSNKHLFTP